MQPILTNFVYRHHLDQLIRHDLKVVKEYDLRDMEEGYHFGNNRYLSYDLEYTTARDLKNMRTAAEVKVRYTVDGEEYTEEIFTVKIRNKWYILPVAYAMPAPVE